MVIATVGKNASGKDYFLEYISSRFDVPRYALGDIARDLAEEKGIEKTRENLHMISKTYMETYGAGFFPNRVIEKIRNSNTQSALVSGIRTPSDVRIFRDAFGSDFLLVAIIVDDDRIRYERTIARGTARDNITFEKFLELDQNEEKLFLTSETLALADYIVHNDVPDEEFHKSIVEFYKNIK